MPLFELASALSCEVVAAHQLADRLSETTGIQQLAEATDSTEALESVTVGISEDPFSEEGYERDELENRHFVARVFAEVEGSHLTGQAPEAMGNPREGGVFLVYLRRQVRESEERSDAYKFFWDRVSSIGPAVILASEQDLENPQNYRFTLADRQIGPAFGERREVGEQGYYLVAELAFTWGDVERE